MGTKKPCKDSAEIERECENLNLGLSICRSTKKFPGKRVTPISFSISLCRKRVEILVE